MLEGAKRAQLKRQANSAADSDTSGSDSAWRQRIAIAESGDLTPRRLLVDTSYAVHIKRQQAGTFLQAKYLKVSQSLL